MLTTLAEVVLTLKGAKGQYNTAGFLGQPTWLSRVRGSACEDNLWYHPLPVKLFTDKCGGMWVGIFVERPLQTCVFFTRAAFSV